MVAAFYGPSSTAVDGTAPYGTQGTIDLLSPAVTTVPAGYGTMRRCIRDGELGVTVYPPVLRHMSNTLPTGRIDVEGGRFTITTSTNLQGWGVKVFESTAHVGTPLITQPADPSQGIAPQAMAVTSSVEIEIPENNTAEAERPLTFVLYCTEYPGTGNEVVVGTWRQHKYYTLTVEDTGHGTVALSSLPAAGKAGYRYGTPVTLTPTTTDADRFFHGWTAEGTTLTPWQTATKPLTITITSDVDITPHFSAVLDHGVQVDTLVWANYNLAMPHAFAVSHLAADVKLYQNYYPNRAPIAWPSSGTINSSNPGYNMATGAAVNAWQATGYPTTISLWPSDYGRMPCPEGWVIPTLAHWENLRDNATHSRVPATGTITGYNYTNSDNQVIYLPLHPRRNWDNTDYEALYPQYMMSATDTDTNGRDWSIATNAQTANGTSYVGAGRVIRCVRRAR
jgi:hypothetical protein